MINVAHVDGGYAKKAVLHDISFQVEQGEFFGIIGPNGSGKTTLLKLLSNVLPTMAGDIWVKGKSLSLIHI